MEEEPTEINWFNTSLSDFDYATSADWNGLDFDEDFNKDDQGQLQDRPITLDEADLLKRLRKESSRDSQVMSPALFEFYDNCKKHFHLEFMTLLKALISNVDTSKKLEENCKAGHLLNFYQLELSSKLKFGQHPICQDAATECNARLKQLIQDFGMKLQIETQVARFLTANELRNKLKACGEDFLEFGKQEWMKQCKKTSRFNILDQHFAVKGKLIEASESTPDDEEVAIELRKTPRSDPDKARFELFKMSAYLFSMAVNDSRRMVDKDIRNRRAQITAANEKAAREKAVQREVDIRADAVKPTDAVETLSQKFEQLHARIDELQRAQADTVTRATAASRTTTLPSEEVFDDDADEENTRRLAALEERLRAIESSGQAAKLQPSKNVRTADSAETQQSTHQPRRRKKRRAETATSESTNATPAPTTPRMMTSGPQAPRPTTQNVGNGSRATWSKQRHPRPPGNQENRGNDQSYDDARRPHDRQQRPRSAERQQDQPRFQRGGGNGRGPGRGPARA